MASSLITQAALSTVEKGLNKLLAMDSSAIEQLAELEDKIIAIQSTTPDYTFFIIPTMEGVFLTNQCEITVDSKLSAPAPILMQLLLSKDKQAFLKSSDVMIVGESAVLYQLFGILDSLNPDWQHELSQWFGPTLAGLAVQSIKLGNEQLQQGITFMQSQMATLFSNVTASDFDNDNKPQNPIMDILGSLQKRFGQS